MSEFAHHNLVSRNVEMLEDPVIADLRADNQGLQAENERLRAENEKLRAENETLRAGNETLRDENELVRAEALCHDTLASRVVKLVKDWVAADLRAENERLEAEKLKHQQQVVMMFLGIIPVEGRFADIIYELPKAQWDSIVKPRLPLRGVRPRGRLVVYDRYYLREEDPRVTVENTFQGERFYQVNFYKRGNGSIDIPSRNLRSISVFFRKSEMFAFRNLGRSLVSRFGRRPEWNYGTLNLRYRSRTNRNQIHVSFLNVPTAPWEEENPTWRPAGENHLENLGITEQSIVKIVHFYVPMDDMPSLIPVFVVGPWQWDFPNLKRLLPLRP